VLSLKGLARDHKRIVGEQALQGLLDIIQNDAELDPDIGRAALETVGSLCDGTELALAHTDRVLADARTVHKLCTLLGDPAFHVRYNACALLAVLLQSRPQATQAHFLTAPVGATTVVALLDETREIISRGACAR